MESDKTRITQAHCNICLGKRNHEILHCYEYVEDERETDAGFPLLIHQRYELLKCCGCNTVTLRHTWWYDGDEDQWGNPNTSISYYPPSIFRRQPNWFAELSNFKDTDYIKNLLNEIYIGLQNSAIKLATMGIRTLLEFIMIQKVGDNGSFTKNLDEFQNQGHISRGQKDILKTVLEAGHATIHRSYSPSEDDLSTCMDITESVIGTIYIHPHKANTLTKKIPKR